MIQIKNICLFVFLLLVLSLLFPFPVYSDPLDYNILHEFTGGGDDGSLPMGSLTFSGDTLYGMAYSGGDYDGGVIFSLDTTGDNFTLLYEFAGGTVDGSSPCDSLTLSGNTLFGMTTNAGEYGEGVVFSLSTDGSDFAVIHNFNGADGTSPHGGLTLSGDTLYGITSLGGNYSGGVIFSMTTAGDDYTLFHEFPLGGNDDGYYSFGSLTLYDNVLYGLASYGGDSNLGIIFSQGTEEEGGHPRTGFSFAFGNWGIGDSRGFG